MIKDGLRSSLCDDVLSSLMLIASEIDLLHSLRNEEIVNPMATAAHSLKTELVHW